MFLPLFFLSLLSTVFFHSATLQKDILLSDELFSRITSITHLEEDTFLITQTGSDYQLLIYDAHIDRIVDKAILRGRGPGESESLLSAIRLAESGMFVSGDKSGNVYLLDDQLEFVKQVNVGNFRIAHIETSEDYIYLFFSMFLIGYPDDDAQMLAGKKLSINDLSVVESYYLEFRQFPFHTLDEINQVQIIDTKSFGFIFNDYVYMTFENMPHIFKLQGNKFEKVYSLDQAVYSIEENIYGQKYLALPEFGSSYQQISENELMIWFGHPSLDIPIGYHLFNLYELELTDPVYLMGETIDPYVHRFIMGTNYLIGSLQVDLFANYLIRKSAEVRRK